MFSQNMNSCEATMYNERCDALSAFMKEGDHVDRSTLYPVFSCKRRVMGADNRMISCMKAECPDGVALCQWVPGSGGKVYRNYTYMSQHDILQAIRLNNRLFEYVTIGRYPFKVYFDIELSVVDDTLLNRAKELVLAKFPDADMAISGGIEARIIVPPNHVKSKTSYHIVLQNYAVYNEAQLKWLKNTVVDMNEQVDGFDTGVYDRKRMIKMVNQKKFDHRAAQAAINYASADELHHHVISQFVHAGAKCLPEADMEEEEKKKKRKNMGRSRSVSSTSVRLGGLEPTVAQLGTIRQMLFELPAEFYDDYQHWLRIGLALSSYSSSRAMLQLFEEWSKQSAKYQPGCCSSAFQGNGTLTIGTLIHYHRTHCKSSKVNYSALRPSIDLLAGIDRVAGVEVAHFSREYVTSIDGKTQVFDVDGCLDGKVVLLKSHTGSGKTVCMKEMTRYFRDRHIDVVSVVSRRCLAKKHSHDFGIDYYEDIEAPYFCESVAVQLDSIDRVARDPDAKYVVMLDEVNSLLAQFKSNLSKMSKERSVLIQAFHTLLSNAHSAFGADADMTTYAIQYIKDIVGNRLDVKLHINDFCPKNKCKQTVCNNIYEMKSKIIHCILNNKPIFVGSDTKGKLSKLLDSIVTELKSKQYAGLISKDTIDRIRLYTSEDGDHDDFLRGKFIEYFVFASPSIVYGIDLNYEADVFGLYFGCNTMHALSCVQQIGRVRKPLSIHLYFDKDSNDTQCDGQYETIEAMQAEHDAAAAQTASYVKFDVTSIDMDCLSAFKRYLISSSFVEAQLMDLPFHVTDILARKGHELVQFTGKKTGMLSRQLSPITEYEQLVCPIKVCVQSADKDRVTDLEDKLSYMLKNGSKLDTSMLSICKSIDLELTKTLQICEKNVVDQLDESNRKLQKIQRRLRIMGVNDVEQLDEEERKTALTFTVDEYKFAEFLNWHRLHWSEQRVVEGIESSKDVDYLVQTSGKMKVLLVKRLMKTLKVESLHSVDIKTACKPFTVTADYIKTFNVRSKTIQAGTKLDKYEAYQFLMAISKKTYPTIMSRTSRVRVPGKARLQCAAPNQELIASIEKLLPGSTDRRAQEKDEEELLTKPAFEPMHSFLGEKNDREKDDREKFWPERGPGPNSHLHPVFENILSSF